jgi:hypothetical protein
VGVLSALVVGLCFGAGLLRNQRALLLSIAVALGAYRLERDLQRLSPELRREVHDFVQLLLIKHGAKPERYGQLDWRSAPQDQDDRRADAKIATPVKRPDIGQLLTDFLARHDLSALHDAVGEDAELCAAATRLKVTMTSVDSSHFCCAVTL